MEIKRKLRAIFQLLTRSAFWNLLSDLTHNMHWLHSELQTIFCTDLSLSALLTCLSCLSLSLSALRSSSTFSLASSYSLSSRLCSKLLKIQVTLLNNISRKSFGSSHLIAHYGLQNHIPQPHLCLSLPSSLLPPLFPVCLSFTKMSRNCICKTFSHCASILWKWINFWINNMWFRQILKFELFFYRNH